MSRASATLLCLGILIMATLACPAAGQDNANDWYSPLKDIPLGPGKLDIGGCFRLRYEVLDNFNSRTYDTDDLDDLLLERVRIHFDYRLSDNFHVFLEGQDAHYWLHKLTIDMYPANSPFQNHMDLRQAYVEWTDIGNTPFGFKVGRQCLSYRDNRVFGPGNWPNVCECAWDAAKLYLNTDLVKLDAIAGQRVQTDPHDFDDDHYNYDLYALYAQIQKLPVDLDLFYVLRYNDHGNTVGESGTGDRKTHTFGAYLNGKLGENIDYGGTLALQCGKFGDDDIEAHGYNLRLGYTFDHPWKPRVGAQFSYATGDDDPTDGDHETFDGIFGTSAAYYGRMNLCSWMNIEDYQLTFSVQPTEKLKLWIDYHYLDLDKAADAWYYASRQVQRQDATGNSGTELGHEIDLMAKWQATKNIEIMAGYAHFFAGDFIKNTPGGSDDADWAFIQFRYSF